MVVLEKVLSMGQIEVQINDLCQIQLLEIELDYLTEYKQMTDVYLNF